jgi:signal transduction histidine kinase
LLDRLARAFIAHRGFIADASHELKTPLAILMSEIESCMKQVERPAEVQRYLTMASAEVERMAHIVDDLDLLANSDSGQYGVRKTWVRLDEVLMKTLSRCQLLAEKDDIRLTVTELSDIEIEGDEDLLVRALSNLISNATKFSHPSGVVRIALLKNELYALYRVQDDGIGIPAESLPKIFERFYRVDNSRSRATGGSGLGLAIVKWIAELHHGEITAASQLGQGSTFTLKLRLSGRPAAQA